MPPIVRTAVVLMLAALALYSVGVWATVLAQRLQPWHASCFWAGFLCDSFGTELMRRLAGEFQWSLHTATGVVALSLMFAHAIWASVVLVRRNDRAQRTFHRLSVVVWGVWLIPFVTGLILGRRGGAFNPP